MSLLTTPAAIRAELENLIDDQLDIDFEYSLLTQCEKSHRGRLQAGNPRLEFRDPICCARRYLPDAEERGERFFAI